MCLRCVGWFRGLGFRVRGLVSVDRVRRVYGICKVSGVYAYGAHGVSTGVVYYGGSENS